MKPLLIVPSGARRTTFPVGGTLILLMMPDHFAWPAWVWSVLWTLWVLVWLGMVAAIVLRGIANNWNTDTISAEKWREVFK